MSAHGLEKIKTIGDGLVSTGTLLQPLDDPVMASVRCALAMLGVAAQYPASWGRASSASISGAIP